MGKRCDAHNPGCGNWNDYKFFFTELIGLTAGGLIVPGYLAFFLDQPVRLISTLLAALLSYAVVVLLSRFMILYSRRRFMAAVLSGYLIGWLLEITLIYFPPVGYDLRVIGFIVPGLIANDMYRQGVINTVLSVFIVSVLVKLVLILL